MACYFREFPTQAKFREFPFHAIRCIRMSIGRCEDHLKPAPKMGESSAPSAVWMASDRALLRCALAEALAAEGVTVLGGEAQEGQRAISPVEQHKP